VDIGAGERGSGIEEGTGLFDDFATGGIGDGEVGGLDVSAGQEPALQAAVMNDEDAFAIGSEDHTAAGDVAGDELFAGERLRGMLEKEEDELDALEGGAIGRGVKLADEGGEGMRVEHKMKKPPV
jgi:hypothetical protein